MHSSGAEAWRAACAYGLKCERIVTEQKRGINILARSKADGRDIKVTALVLP